MGRTRNVRPFRLAAFFHRIPFHSDYLGCSTSRLLLCLNFLRQNVGMDRAAKFGFAFFFLLGMPFALFGLWAFGQAWHQFDGAPSNTPFWLPLMFGVIFSAIGFGLMSIAVFGSKRYKRQMLLQAEHPTEPWLWRADWAEGRVKSNTRGNMIGGWVFAIGWNLVSTPVAVLVLPRALQQKGPVVLLALIFPAVGVYLLIRAIRLTLAYFEFGKTCFVMATVPAVIGLELKGMIEARFPRSPDHSVHLRLSCVHKVTTGQGDSRTTQETIVWRDEADLAPGQLFAGPVGTTIPVAFRIPRDAHPTEKMSSHEEFVWLLEALADVPGVNYHDAFEVPVFRTTATLPEEEPAAAVQEFAPAVQPARMTIKTGENAEGTEFYFPAARNRDMAAVTTGFAGMMIAITFVTARAHIPFFPLVIGFFAIVLTYLAVQMWFGTTRVVIGRSLKFQDGLLGGGKVREVPFAEIASIDDVIRTQKGGATGTPYYDIVLKRRDGGSLTLGRTLASKYEAEWLVAEMRRLACGRPKAEAASRS